MSDDNWWASSPFATAASAKAATVPSGRAKTTSQDMQLLRDSTTKAEVERKARREYAAVRQSIIDMNTGPGKARYLDAITSEQDGGVWDFVGATLGSPLTLFVSDKTSNAREHLKTVGAQVALAGAQQQKGQSSDKDMASLRMAGVSDYKKKAENLRILRTAERDGAIEQHRATLKSKWISRFGSISAPGPNGLTYEEAASRQEALVNKAVDLRERGLPKPPPSSARRASSGRTVIDLNGNPIR